MERQEHCPQLQNQNDAFLDHFNLHVRVRNMDPYSMIQDDTSYSNEMLPKTSKHLLTRGIMLLVNEEVRNTVSHAIGSYEDLITTMRKRKLSWSGHIAISTGLAKIIPDLPLSRRDKSEWIWKKICGKKNLNDIAPPPPPPPYLIGDLWKVFTRKEERKALLHDIEV